MPRHLNVIVIEVDHEKGGRQEIVHLHVARLLSPEGDFAYATILVPKGSSGALPDGNYAGIVLHPEAVVGFHRIG